MKLLFDENLSPKLVNLLADIFPDSVHVDRVGLGGKTDDEVWCYAKANGFILVSKDSDFYDKNLLYGHPPKVIWIKRG
jgi:predicted nuclease of predicted toxin-antitoxin system